MLDEEYRDAFRRLEAAPGDDEVWRELRSLIERGGGAPEAEPVQDEAARTVKARAAERRVELSDSEMGKVGKRMADIHRLRYGTDPPRVDERLDDKPWIRTQSFRYPASEMRLLDLAIDAVVAKREPAVVVTEEKPVAKPKESRTQESRLNGILSEIADAARKLGDESFPHSRQNDLSKIDPATLEVLASLRHAWSLATDVAAREALKTEPTRRLLDWLNRARISARNEYSPWPGAVVTLDEIKAELAKREHVPSKAESRDKRRVGRHGAGRRV